MPTPQPHILKITSGEDALALSIIRDTAQFCMDNGHPMWPLEELTLERLSAGASMTEFYVGRVQGVPAAAMFMQDADPLMWPEKRDNAQYVHKLCVLRKFGGQDLSGQMLQHATRQAVRRRADFLRLDTYVHSTKLCAMYERYGLSRVGTITLKNVDYALFEKKLASP